MLISPRVEIGATVSRASIGSSLCLSTSLTEKQGDLNRKINFECNSIRDIFRPTVLMHSSLLYSNVCTIRGKLVPHCV
jgi:hypothetical protein